jgi:DNA (cytosine-5)-methyltransferase 1
MKLYQEIILLETVAKGEDARFKGKYVVENVIPYYEPLIQGQKRGRHLYWANFILPHMNHRQSPKIGGGKNEVDQWCKFHEYDFKQYKGSQPMNKIARNLVDYEAGLTIFNTAKGIHKSNNTEQQELFI